MNKFCIVIDTETTGMPADARAKVVSIGAVAYDLGEMKEVGHFYSVVKPSVYAKSFPYTVKIHGLTRPYIEKNGKSPAEVWRRFQDWIVGEYAKSLGTNEIYFLAWNSRFDNEMLRRLRVDAGGRSDRIDWADFEQGNLRGPKGCLMQMYRKAQPGKSYKLASASLHLLGEQQTAVHNALSDARLAGGVFLSLLGQEKK
jgi:DNA polymerase III epsilon subunit-like protein